MIKLIKIDIKEFEEKIYEEYIKLFPEEEQRDWENIKNSYNKGIEKFYKIVKNNTIIGFIMLEKICDTYPYYMDYFAIFKRYQNKGYGTQAIKQLLIEIGSNQELFIEIEKEEESNYITMKRAKFYERLGFKKVKSEYLLYGILYTPYIYTKNDNVNKKRVDKIMFDYYIINCGKEAVQNNCKLII